MPAGLMARGTRRTENCLRCFIACNHNSILKKLDRHKRDLFDAFNFFGIATEQSAIVTVYRVGCHLKAEKGQCSLFKIISRSD